MVRSPTRRKCRRRLARWLCRTGPRREPATSSGANRFGAGPARELADVLDLGQASTRLAPEVRPDLPIGDDAGRPLTTARDEAWKGGASGRLADGLIPQVEAPADAVTGIRERRVLGQMMKEQHPAAFD